MRIRSDVCCQWGIVGVCTYLDLASWDLCPWYDLEDHYEYKHTYKENIVSQFNDFIIFNRVNTSNDQWIYTSLLVVHYIK